LIDTLPWFAVPGAGKIKEIIEEKEKKELVSMDKMPTDPN
jgi:hypothetical protein